MKLNAIKYFFIFLVPILGLSCDNAELKFTLVNKTGRTLTTYSPRILPPDKSSMFRHLFRKNSTNPEVSKEPRIRLNFKVDPYATKDYFSMGSFGGQFTTPDGKLHLIILDVDSLKSMALHHTLDSNSIRRAILKHLIISRAELEKNNKTIVYED
jgi:hypothetical protein